ncbi:hypothetical protein [Filimonas effusa]|uniref:Uncharacterized protein n=1 Tax=Filimonas effusa TaxID=2508721 RepID=A0A4Q1DD21_9BACT|nr:hypothetical protein [Filimonas effusa]RXK86449.1 hypothetical protein ESB13_06480 [Filimonas effusa]
MSLGPALLKLLDKKYAPLTMVEQKFKGYDLSFKTDVDGLPILLFIGKRDEGGNVRGERYARRLAKDKEGAVIKDHWDFKGKAS